MSTPSQPRSVRLIRPSSKKSSASVLFSPRSMERNTVARRCRAARRRVRRGGAVEVDQHRALLGCRKRSAARGCRREKAIGPVMERAILAVACEPHRRLLGLLVLIEQDELHILGLDGAVVDELAEAIDQRLAVRLHKDLRA